MATVVLSQSCGILTYFLSWGTDGALWTWKTLRKEKPRVIKERVIHSKCILAMSQPSIILVPATAGDFPGSIHSQNALHQLIKPHFCNFIFSPGEPSRLAVCSQVHPHDGSRAVPKADSRTRTSALSFWLPASGWGMLKVRQEPQDVARLMRLLGPGFGFVPWQREPGENRRDLKLGAFSGRFWASNVHGANSQQISLLLVHLFLPNQHSWFFIPVFSLLPEHLGCPAGLGGPAHLEDPVRRQRQT